MNTPLPDTAPSVPRRKRPRLSSFAEKFVGFSPYAAGIAIGAAVLASTFFLLAILQEEIDLWLKETTPREGASYVVSWLILLFISCLASYQVREIMRARSNDQPRRRANLIAIMIALVLIVFLFKQPFLDKLFAGQNPGTLAEVLLFAGGTGGGWLVWYLGQVRKYGEFFNIFLLTAVTGFCWYARLTAPEEVQLTAVAFLLGSLFHIAKDYLDQATLSDQQKGV